MPKRAHQFPDYGDRKPLIVVPSKEGIACGGDEEALP